MLAGETGSTVNNFNCSADMKLHEHLLGQLQQGFTFLSEKYGELSLLPQKVEQQTKILEEIKGYLSVLPEHQVQLAVMQKTLDGYPKLVEAVNKMLEVVTRHDEQLKSYPDTQNKVTQHETERNFVKWQLPLLLTLGQVIVSATVFIVMKKWGG